MNSPVWNSLLVGLLLLSVGKALPAPQGRKTPTAEGYFQRGLAKLKAGEGRLDAADDFTRAIKLHPRD